VIVALRYVEKEGGFWEVRTEDAIEQRISVRQFQEHKAIAPLATRAIQEPGVWVEVAYGREYEKGE
jgi:hypothetical protein